MNSSCAPARVFAPFSSAASFLYRISLTNEDLPEPETPVTQVSVPSGIVKSVCLRLFTAQPLTVMLLPLPLRRISGTGMNFLPERYCPVMDLSLLSSSSIVPSNTTSPPLRPAPGPISTMWSAANMVSSSCSTTMSVLPRSRSRPRVASSLSLSRWCRPMDGSSRIYSTPISDEPICVASRMRWLSPPDSVPDERESVRYSSPTDCKKPRRSIISLITLSPILCCISVSLSVWRNSIALTTDFSANSAIFSPPSVTASTSGRRRRPWHAGHGLSLITSSISPRDHSLLVSR